MDFVQKKKKNHEIMIKIRKNNIIINYNIMFYRYLQPYYVYKTVMYIIFCTQRLWKAEFFSNNHLKK